MPPPPLYMRVVCLCREEEEEEEEEGEQSIWPDRGGACLFMARGGRYCTGETGMAWIDSRLGETKGHSSQFAYGTIRLKLLRFDGARRL